MSFYYLRVTQLRDIMVKYGDSGKEIWFTEFGWPSSPNPYPEYAYAKNISEDDQARFLVRAFQIAREKGYVGVMAVWDLNYASSAEPDDRYAKLAFSVLRRDWSPRPAYIALRDMPK
jgi:exo-beta-1,3-glucanase (GH17 family)